MEEKTLNLSGYKCQALINKADGTPIVFLHGLNWTVEVWQHIKIVDTLFEKKIPFLALDMPYGLKSDCQPKTREVEPNVEFAKGAIKSVFGDAAPVLVGASLGGYMALNYAAKYPVKGLFLVSPAYAFKNMDLASKYSGFNFPARIVWGSKDTVISGEEMRTLADKLPNAKLLVYNDAAHSAYVDQPEWFRTDLLKLYIAATI
jgi:Predicted hydrolases or acyltransferases (alpha/beta hydrolase superfamily)